MTTADVLAVLLRRWYVVAVGLGLTALVTFMLMSRPGVYTTRVDVVLVPPPKSDLASTGLVNTSQHLIATAGLLERLVNSNTETSAATSQDVALVGTGVRRGTLIKLPNSGGQWDYDFTAPMLSVQVAGPTAEEVLSARNTGVRRIKKLLAELQRYDGVRAERMITTQVIPEKAPVVYATGHPSRAGAVAIVIGGASTLVVTIGFDSLLVRSRRRKRDAAVSSLATTA